MKKNIKSAIITEYKAILKKQQDKLIISINQVLDMVDDDEYILTIYDNGQILMPYDKNMLFVMDSNLHYIYIDGKNNKYTVIQ